MELLVTYAIVFGAMLLMRWAYRTRAARRVGRRVRHSGSAVAAVLMLALIRLFLADRAAAEEPRWP